MVLAGENYNLPGLFNDQGFLAIFQTRRFFLRKVKKWKIGKKMGIKEKEISKKR